MSLFLVVPWVCLRFVIVVFPDHTHYFETRFIVIKNFAKSFLNFIDDTLICYVISKLDLNLLCAKDFQNLSSMVTWCVN